MKTSKRDLKEFLLFKYGILEKQALFEREIAVLFKEFGAWYREQHWGKAPAGVTLKIFTGWLKKSDTIIILTKSNRK